MKPVFSLLLVMIFARSYAQNIGINATGATPHASAMLDVSSTTKGFLAPRMTTAQRTAITSPAIGLMVYDTDTNNFWFFNGVSWTQVSTGSATNYWSANGNDIFNNNSGNVGIGTNTPSEKLTVKAIGNGITHTDGTIKLTTYLGSDAAGDPAGGWLGTASNHPLYFYANGGAPRMSVLTNGNVGIGTTNPISKLSVQTPTNSFGLTHTDGTVTLETYISTGQGWIGTGSNHPLTFFTNGLQQMTITANGNVGIGTGSPANKLQIGALGTSGFNGNDIALGNGTNATGLFQSNSILQVASTTDIAFLTRSNGTGLGNLGINTATPTNQLQIGSVGSTGFNGNNLAVGNGTNATGFAQSNSFLQVASSTNIVFLPQANNGGGRVGINTSTPRAPLDVIDYVAIPNSNYDYLNYGSSLNDIQRCSPCTANVSIRAESAVYAAEFDANSDARIKNVTGMTNSEKDLETINSLRITDYTMKDKVKYGNKPFKKVIAQEVEKVYPQVISTHTDFIPNVYQLTHKVEKTADGYLLTFIKKHNLTRDAKKLKLLSKESKAMEIVDVENIPSDYQVLVKGTNITDEQLFVYGEEVDDFHTVDYEGLTTLNISATQELSKQLKAQQAAIEAQNIKITQLMATIILLKDKRPVAKRHKADKGMAKN
ncbi:tail fiber domain-containing protein [Flavisolibacter ginsenosidimutans]|uniref:Peptidase S74 domain-containing protein n=1 Tax=Flavisolibacter ginsenosidimutans TaxID=661481 RepID=A0A5B8UE51_9BACT|nr:tail fiber domain-containing protein [Flavisolibacter ginsenosidimutans]QEC54576.1 hypothetical protein FSB75_01230 [Flavisolibacter ginsenosidimutans]